MFGKEKLGKAFCNLDIEITYLGEQQAGDYALAIHIAEALFGGKRTITEHGYIIECSDPAVETKNALLYVDENLEGLVNLDLILNHRDKSKIEGMPSVYFYVGGRKYRAHAEGRHLVIAGREFFEQDQ